MAAIADISLNDAAATPVAHTFSPQPDINGALARWVDRSGGIALGYPMLSMLFRMPNRQSRNYKVTQRVVLPILEATSPSTSSGIQPAPTLAYALVANTDYVLPERSSLQERKDFLAFHKGFTAGSVIQAAIWNFEPVY